MQELFPEYPLVEKEIIQRLEEFSSISKKKEIFYELCFCILTPQSKGKRCGEAVSLLEKKEFYIKALRTSSIAQIIQPYARFHHTKAKRLVLLKKSFETFYKLLEEQKERSIDQGETLRDWLIENINGFGYKEASHFLRNIGFRDLAILDRHILRELLRLKVINELPKTLTKNQYLLIEEKFRTFSQKKNISLDHLDLYFWYMATGEVFK